MHTSIGVVETHHMNMDYSAWEGWETAGRVSVVVSRGEVLVSDDGQWHGAKGRGRFLRRGLSSYLV